MTKADIARSDNYSFTVDNGREAQICGCARVLLYESNIIKVRLPHCSLCICGKALTLSSFFPKEITVRGIINSVSVEDD